MSLRILVAPAPGLIVRDPRNMRAIPDSGQWVTLADKYWRCKLRHGEIIVLDPPQTKTKKKKANKGLNDG